MNLLLQSVLEAHPLSSGSNLRTIVDAVHALSLCEQVCVVASDAALSEVHADRFQECARLQQECAAVCAATISLLLRHPSSETVLHAQLHACAIACQTCGDACAVHAIRHEHCAVCAEACRRCQERCNVALGEFSPAVVALDE